MSLRPNNITIREADTIWREAGRLVRRPLALQVRPLPRSRADGRRCPARLQRRPDRRRCGVAAPPAPGHRVAHVRGRRQVPPRRFAGQQRAPRTWCGAGHDVLPSWRPALREERLAGRGMRFIQFWILPSVRGLETRVQQQQYRLEDRTDRWLQIMGPAGTEGLDLAQDARALVSHLTERGKLEHAFGPGRGGYLYVIDGRAIARRRPAEDGRRGQGHWRDRTGVEHRGRRGAHPHRCSPRVRPDRRVGGQRGVTG